MLIATVTLGSETTQGREDINIEFSSRYCKEQSVRRSSIDLGDPCMFIADTQTAEDREQRKRKDGKEKESNSKDTLQLSPCYSKKRSGKRWCIDAVNPCMFVA